MKREVTYIKYIDAFYIYEEKINLPVKFTTHEAFGYIEEKSDDYVITFVMRNEDSKKKSKEIIKGLIIPKTAVVSNSKFLQEDFFKSIHVGNNVGIEWKDVVYVANQTRAQSSRMYTVGKINKIGKKYTVIESPTTERLWPLPRVKHPTKKPTFYIIPKSLITKVEKIYE